MSQAAEQSRAVDVPTIAAIGALSGLLMLVVHEVLGHSLATVLMGVHLVHLTSIDSSWNGTASLGTMRIIAGAGITANLLIGCAVLGVARSIPAGAFTARYFAWFFGHATLFMGSSYLAGFAFLPVGDVHAAIQALPFQLAWQVVFVLAGVAIYWATLLDAGRTLGRWTSLQDRSLTSTLTLVPYLAMGISETLAGLLNPQGAIYGAVWAAAATFGANSGVLIATNFMSVAAARTHESFRVPRSGAWIAAGVASMLAVFFVLGPGVPR